MVRVEQTRCACDHCDELGPGVIITSVIGEQISSVQLCEEHARWLSTELYIETAESAKLARSNPIKEESI